MNMIFKNWSRLKKNKKKGFTLVELLIVIAVLGIISGIGINSMQGVVDTFRQKADERTSEQIARNVEILVMAGKITGDVSAVDGIDYPDSQSTGEKFSAEVSFSNNKNTCEVIITAGDGFEHTIEIYPNEIK